VRGDFVDPGLGQLTVADWAEEWVAGLHVKPKTRAGYMASLRNHVLPAFGGAICGEHRLSGLQGLRG
jgi:Phage integrase, N-terminal SAM-like domain